MPSLSRLRTRLVNVIEISTKLGVGNSKNCLNTVNKETGGSIMRLLSGVLVILSDGTRAVIDLILSGTYEKDQLAGELDIIIRKLVLFRTNNFIA